MEQNEEVENWLSSFDIKADADQWTIQFTLSTVDMQNWFYRRNRLKDEDVKLTLIVPQWGSWVAQVERKDGLYVAQWRPNGNFSVDSQQMKYWRLMQWPSLERLEKFPSLVKKIEDVLDVKFIRHVDIGARDINIAREIKDSGKMIGWLSECADSYGQDYVGEGS